jgi:hypothetical protein
LKCNGDSLPRNASPVAKPIRQNCDRRLRYHGDVLGGERGQLLFGNDHSAIEDSHAFSLRRFQGDEQSRTRLETPTGSGPEGAWVQRDGQRSNPSADLRQTNSTIRPQLSHPM